MPNESVPTSTPPTPKPSEKSSPAFELKAQRHTLFTRLIGLPFLRVVFWTLLRIYGPLKAFNKRNLPRKGGILILANHLADIDPPAVQLSAIRPIHFMAKSELFEMKSLKWILKLMDTFPVRRGEPDKSAIKHSVNLLKMGEAVCIFPEGELSQSGDLQPLKPGVGLIIRMAGVPVICAGIKNTNKVLPYGETKPRKSGTKCIVTWGEPMQFDKSQSNDEILAAIEAQLRTLIA